MSHKFTKISDDKLSAAIAELLCPKIENILCNRGPGHCMRINDLHDDVLKSICKKLREYRPDGNIFILGDRHQENERYRVTSTKLIELRNPGNNSELRQPLLVFIPTSVRTSAEDSFGIATFEELTFPTIYKDLGTALLGRLPKKFVGSVGSVFSELKNEEWPFADDLARVRYLLTVLENGADDETLGACLYEFALIPDFKLFTDLMIIQNKTHRNLNCVRSLMTSHKSAFGRITDLKLAEKGLVSRLFTYFEKHDVQEPEFWTPHIASDKNWWDISFDKWAFREELSLDSIKLTNLKIDLPVMQKDETDEQMAGNIEQKVLDPTERREMNVEFEVNTHPGKVRGLENFQAQIISHDEELVIQSKEIKAWKPGRLHGKIKFTKLNKTEFEKGWHFIRIIPRTAEGELIPLAAEPGDENAKSANESDHFYVLPGSGINEDPPQRSMPTMQSLEHARFQLQLDALRDGRNPADIAISGANWVEVGRSKKTSRIETLQVKFGSDGGVKIQSSSKLKEIELRILDKPKNLCIWRMQINQGVAETPTEVGVTLPSSAAVSSFLAARSDFFSTLRQDSVESIMQTLPLQESEVQCLAYADAYLDLINSLMRQAEISDSTECQQILLTLRNVLAIDSINVVTSDFRERYREAILVAPNHPLRALWLFSWSTLVQNWIEKIKSGSKDHIPYVRSALLEGFMPSAYPVGVPDQDGRLFTPVGNLNAFWSIYAPTTEVNSRSLLAEICSALGLAEPSASGADISGQVIADKIGRYLAQHPYVRELSINIFKPGAGLVMADALKLLQGKKEHADLRYDIRLFTLDPDSPVPGEALELLVRPETTVNEAADAFATPTKSHLSSKLNLAKHSHKEFYKNTQKFRAHISILLDVFPAVELSIAKKSIGVAPLHGLMQDYGTEFIDDSSGVFWKKWPIVGRCLSLDNNAGCFDLLSSLSQKICYATSAVSASGSSYDSTPIVTLGLEPTERQMIYAVHEYSDWVFTIDRNMGIEFFDHGGRKNRDRGGREDRPDYLIDYVPGSSSQATHNLIISSRSNAELEAMLKPVLQKFGLMDAGRQSAQILANLRSLSGQLALKLISSPSQQAEALGLALARMYLEFHGALSNQIIVPLDAHTDLYRSSAKADDANDGISLQRTDLALFDLDLENRKITCKLVEVKCFSQVGTFQAYNELKKKITEQINQSERIFQRHFDPSVKKPDRPDRLFKSRELARILRFYLDRSVRYEIFDETAAQEARCMIESIEQGYSLQFNRCALIFDFNKDGTENPDIEVGIEYHRIGKDHIRALLDRCPKTVSDETVEELIAPDVVGGELSLSDKIVREQTIQTVELPKLASAAFIAPMRARSTTWTVDELFDDDAQDAATPLTPPLEDSGSISDHGEIDIQPKSSKPGLPKSISPENYRKVEQSTVTATDAFAKEQTDVTAHQATESTNKAEVIPDIMLGVNDDSPQYGLLGEVAGRKVALDLNQTHTISLFGVQGGGKSYTLGTVIEMASMPLQRINVLPSPLATVIFHYSPTLDYAPEFTSMINANSVEEEIKILRERYKAHPEALKDVLILTPLDKIDERRAEHPDIEIMPIAFSASELKAAHWKFLMGALGNQSMYLRQINLIMKGLRGNLTLEALQAGIENSGLSVTLKELAQARLEFAKEYIDDAQRLQDFIRPGRLIIVDLRDEYIDKNDALGLFVVMLQIFSEATYQGADFNKLVVFDEAHKYIDNADLISGLVEVVREMRHKGTSIMVASQDPPSVPVALIELSTQIIMHKFNSPAWLKHIQKANAALRELTPNKMSDLSTGEAYVWASKASDEAFTSGAVKIQCRPRITQHGGSTKTAIGD